jgi:hypothetical protein
MGADVNCAAGLRHFNFLINRIYNESRGAMEKAI